jgi:hypothetical protein
MKSNCGAIPKATYQAEETTTYYISIYIASAFKRSESELLYKLALQDWVPFTLLPLGDAS